MAAASLAAAGAEATHSADESAGDGAAAADVAAANDEDDKEDDLEGAGVAGAWCGLRNGLRTRHARIFAIVSLKPIAEGASSS